MTYTSRVQHVLTNGAVLSSDLANVFFYFKFEEKLYFGEDSKFFILFLGVIKQQISTFIVFHP